MTGGVGGLLAKLGQPFNHGGYGLEVIALQSTVAIVFSDGRVAFGNDGPVHISSATLLSACAGADGNSIIVGTDCGAVIKIQSDGSHATLAELGAGKWVEHVAQSAASHGLVAAVGKQACIIDARAATILRVAHPSTITGLAFDPKGKRFAASHYGGASLNWLSGTGAGSPLPWKGSHTALTWSADGSYVVTAMQECALHGWRITDKAHMRMGGYPTKTRSMAWTKKSRWLATSGAQAVVCWPFFHKDGPMGKPPVELPGHGPIITRVAVETNHDFIAAGFEDGTVTLFRFDDQSELTIAPESGSPVTGLAFSKNGSTLGLVREDGTGGVLALPG